MDGRRPPKASVTQKTEKTQHCFAREKVEAKTSGASNTAAPVSTLVVPLFGGATAAPFVSKGAACLLPNQVSEKCSSQRGSRPPSLQPRGHACAGVGEKSGCVPRSRGPPGTRPGRPGLQAGAAQQGARRRSEEVSVGSVSRLPSRYRHLNGLGARIRTTRPFFTLEEVQRLPTCQGKEQPRQGRCCNEHASRSGPFRSETLGKKRKMSGTNTHLSGQILGRPVRLRLWS